jgi:hypothetical protein
LKRAVATAALALLGLGVGTASAEQGPPIPVGQYWFDMAAEQAALDAQAGVAAQAQFVQECATIYAGQCVGASPPIPVIPPPPLFVETPLPRGPAVLGGNRAREQQTPAARVYNLRLTFTPPHKTFVSAEGAVHTVPTTGNIVHYYGVVRMVRYDDQGIPRRVGLPVIVDSDKTGMVNDANVGAPCRARRRAPALYYVSATFGVVTNTGKAYSGTRYSTTSTLAC